MIAHSKRTNSFTLTELNCDRAVLFPTHCTALRHNTQNYFFQVGVLLYSNDMPASELIDH